MKNVVKEEEDIEQFDITSVNKTEYTINFTCTFKEPYLLGLLNKKSDMLTFYIYNTTEAIELLILNSTGEEMASNSTSKRIEMQFDFRSNNV